MGHDKVHQDDPYVAVCIGGCFSFLRDSFVCVNRVEEQDTETFWLRSVAVASSLIQGWPKQQAVEAGDIWKTRLRLLQ